MKSASEIFNQTLLSWISCEINCVHADKKIVNTKLGDIGGCYLKSCLDIQFLGVHFDLFGMFSFA